MWLARNAPKKVLPSHNIQGILPLFVVIMPTNVEEELLSLYSLERNVSSCTFPRISKLSVSSCTCPKEENQMLNQCTEEVEVIEPLEMTRPGFSHEQNIEGGCW